MIAAGHAALIAPRKRPGKTEAIEAALEFRQAEILQLDEFPLDCDKPPTEDSITKKFWLAHFGQAA
jgi:hypothetical protein